MDNQSVMSLLRETETDVETWYAATRRQRPRQRPRDWDAEGMKTLIDQVITPENRSWYYKTILNIDKPRRSDQNSLNSVATGHKSLNLADKAPHLNSRSVTAGSSHSRTPSLEESLNKPLPPLPQPPYFEYMFADAGVKDNSAQHIVNSPSKAGNAEGIILSQTEQLQARKYAPTDSTSSDSSIGLDSTEIAQFACAHAGVDIFTRENGRTRQAQPRDDAFAQGEPMQFERSQTLSHPKSKVILAPKSQKSKACLRNGQYINAAAQTTSATPAVQPLKDATLKVNKRCARDSFVTKPTGKDDNDDYDITLLATKKARIEEKRHSRNVRSMRASSVYSTITASSSSSSFEDILPKPPLTSYPGQFESYESEFLHHRVSGIPAPRVHFTCGDPLHPNNRFTHTNFLADPTWPSKNYTKEDLDRFPMRKAALDYADNLTIRAARNLTRTQSEEDLRREIQRECASARLEGVGVGQYRYYQGHMTMEEYKNARMCICWDTCWCSKVCTIYGDVLCPCNEWIVLNNH